MVKAGELLKQQKIRKEKEYMIFNKIHSKIESRIVKASSSNYFETWYLIPEFILGIPKYSLEECINYIIDKFKKDGFKTQLFEPNLLYIRWKD
jgi:hypothetical protein